MVRARDPGGRSFLTAVLEPSTQVVADMKYSGDQEWSPLYVGSDPDFVALREEAERGVHRGGSSSPP